MPREKKQKKSLGHKIGAGIGGFLGNLAETGVKRIFGMGDYEEALGEQLGGDLGELTIGPHPAKNGLIQPATSADIPIFGKEKEGMTVFARREFITAIQISDTPSILEIPINPGFTTVFPWLSGIANSWQQFAVLGFAAEYVPTSGLATGSTNAALGQVAMAFRYNVAQERYSIGLQGILNIEGAVSMSPAAPGVCYMECDPDMNNQFVRWTYNPDLPDNPMDLPFSQQNYVNAILDVRTEGSQSPTAFQCGQLWFTYQIALINPIPDLSPPAPLISDKFTQARNEYFKLLTYVGPCTDEERLRIRARMRVLTAIFNTLEYADAMAQRSLQAGLNRLEFERKHADEEIPPEVAQFVRKKEVAQADEVMHLLENQRAPRPSPQSAAAPNSGIGGWQVPSATG